MGETQADAHMRVRGVTKHRFKATALIVAVTSGLLALAAPPASAATITQDGPRNYVGPAPCPADATDCATVPAGDGNIVINQTTSDPAGYNKVVFASTASGSGSNSVTDQRAAVNQTGASNSIDGTFIATHTVSNGLNLSQVTQTAAQRFTTRQYGDNNVLKIKGQENESASSSLNAFTQVTHRQRTLIDVDSRLCGAGSNADTCTPSTSSTADIDLDRTQTSTAGGANPAQFQDTESAVGSEGGFGLGRINLIANSSSADTYKVRGNDNKTQTGNALLGQVTQQQGHSSGGWAFEGDIDSSHPDGATLDIGSVASGEGLIKTWTQSKNNGPAQVQTDPGSITLPLIGSPGHATAFIDCNLTANPGARQFCAGAAKGHTDVNFTVDLHNNLNDGDSQVNKEIHRSAQSVNVSTSACQNVSDCPDSTTDDAVTSTHQAVVNTSNGESYGAGLDSPASTHGEPGDVVEYKSSLLNESDASVVVPAGASLQTSVPSGTTFVSCDGCDGGAPDGSGNVTWSNLPEIAGGSAASRALRVSINAAPAGTEITNSASGDADGAGPDAASQSGSTTVTVDEPSVQQVDLLISGTDRKTGQIPVSVLSDADFDATKVVVQSVCFGDAEDASQRDCTLGNKGSSNTDVDGDGDLDKKLHYEAAQTGIDPTDTKACATGVTTTGQAFEGCGALPTR